MTSTTTAKAGGAPAAYSRALGLRICDRAAAGASPRGLRDPPLRVFQADLRAWLDGDPEFAALFGLACAAGVTPAAMLAAALDAQSRRLADEVTAISDAASPETLQISRMRIAARQWLAVRLARQTPEVPGRAVADAEGWPPGLVVEAAEF